MIFQFSQTLVKKTNKKSLRLRITKTLMTPSIKEIPSRTDQLRVGPDLTESGFNDEFLDNLFSFYIDDRHSKSL